MKLGVPDSEASATFSRPIGFDSKTWRYVEPLFEELRQAQPQTGGSDSTVIWQQSIEHSNNGKTLESRKGCRVSS
jgi:hypothetical protein